LGVDGDELIQQVEYEINKYNDKPEIEEDSGKKVL